MIYIVTAMYAEAHTLITYFHLKKEISQTHFQVFLNKEANLCLIITGTGSVPAAAAVSSICTEYAAGCGDFLLNVGVCAQIQTNKQHTIQTFFAPDDNNGKAEHDCQQGKIFLCSKIKEQITGKTFYPDILYRHPFTEAPIVTGAKPYKNAEQMETEDTACYLYDMEAAAIYQAGSYYLGPHQMSFLKIVSDNGNTGEVTSAQIEYLVEKNKTNIADYISVLQMIVRNEDRDDIFQSITQPELEKLCCDMHCSKTMSESVRQYIRYCILSGADYASAIEKMYRNGKLPCKDKREGKKCFEELKEQLL